MVAEEQQEGEEETKVVLVEKKKNQIDNFAPKKWSRDSHMGFLLYKSNHRYWLG